LNRRKFTPRPVLAFGLLSALLVCAPRVHGQSTFGRIVGSVRDASGAAVPNATISAREVDENTTQTTISNDQGLYELPNLKAGRYELAATKARFSKFRIVEIILPAREEVRADVRLELAPVEESIVVSGTAAIMNTENGTISDTKSFREITELPLNYRGVTTSPLAVLMTVPGVQQDMLARSSIGGGLPAQIEYSLDGISTMDVRGSLNNFGPLSDMYPSTEMIHEFKVISVMRSTGRWVMYR
jgi:hypothetical protein